MSVSLLDSTSLPPSPLAGCDVVASLTEAGATSPANLRATALSSAEANAAVMIRPTEARILVIDDERINTRIIEKGLQQTGYRNITTHTHSETAYEKIKSLLPDVVLCDVRMPVSGMTVLQNVVADPALVHVPMIMMTASDDESLRAQALEIGATDLLSKPLKLTELLPRVRSALLVKSHLIHLQHHNRLLEQEVQRRTAELSASRTELLHCLARLAEYRDNETGRHVLRVGRYAGLLARELKLDAETTELIEQAAPLHDIGKIGIPDAILLKPGKLTPEEYEIMQRHVSLGKRAFEPLSSHEVAASASHADLGNAILRCGTSPLLKMAAEIALTHHERWDGTGYPMGLSGEEIPISGRIVAVADVFDALSTKRHYKPAYPIDKSFAAIEDGSGTHFDPAVARAFRNVRDQVLEVRIALSDLE